MQMFRIKAQANGTTTETIAVPHGTTVADLAPNTLLGDDLRRSVNVNTNASVIVNNTEVPGTYVVQPTDVISFRTVASVKGSEDQV